MAKKKLGKKQIDALINSIYAPNCSGIQIDMLDIPKVFDVGRQAYADAIAIDGNSIESIRALITERVVNFVNTIRKN